MDAYVSEQIALTHGRMYVRLAGRLARYPIPSWPFPFPAHAPAAAPLWVLDLGCGWGRWALSAARAGHRAIGVDRSLPALRAARRTTAELVAENRFPAASPLWVCADLNHLPFRSASFDQAIAYGVWQYLPGRGGTALWEAWALLRAGGHLRLQLPHRFGLRALAMRSLAALGRPGEATVTYWTLPEMRQLAATGNGQALRLHLAAEGFFSTNAQWEDRDLLPLRFRCLVAASRNLRRLCRRFPVLLRFADAIWLELSRPSAHEAAR